MFSVLLAGLLHLFSNDSSGSVQRALEDGVPQTFSSTFAPQTYTTFAPPTLETSVSPLSEAQSGDVLGALLMAGAIYMIVGASLAIIIHVGYIVYACMYKSNVTNKRPNFRGGDVLKGGDFKQGTCGCFEDCDACLHGWCCLACRWGDTYEAAGLMGYWTLIAILFLTSFLSNGIAQGLRTALFVQVETREDLQKNQQTSNLINIVPLIFEIALAAFFATKRGELKEKLGGTKNFCVDCLCYFFCVCCTVIQEGRAVDQATGVEVHCCCSLVKVGENMVGEPMVVSGSESGSGSE